MIKERCVSRKGKTGLEEPIARPEKGGRKEKTLGGDWEVRSN